MKTARYRSAAAACIHLFNLVAVACCVAKFFIRRGDGNMQVVGTACFRYFTVDSNILAALSGAAALPFCLRAEGRDGAALPDWVRVLRAVGTTSVMVTFLTVMLMLGPMFGYASMVAGNNLYLHLICPLLSLVSFVLLERDGRLSVMQSLVGVLPVAAYGAVYLERVVIRHAWPDFYGFNIGGRWPLSAVAMLTATAALCLALRALHNRRPGSAVQAPTV